MAFRRREQVGWEEERAERGIFMSICFHGQSDLSSRVGGLNWYSKFTSSHTANSQEVDDRSHLAHRKVSLFLCVFVVVYVIFMGVGTH